MVSECRKNWPRSGGKQKEVSRRSSSQVALRRAALAQAVEQPRLLKLRIRHPPRCFQKEGSTCPSIYLPSHLSTASVCRPTASISTPTSTSVSVYPGLKQELLQRPNEAPMATVQDPAGRTVPDRCALRWAEGQVWLSRGGPPKALRVQVPLNMRYTPQTIIRTPHIKTLHAPYFGLLGRVSGKVRDLRRRALQPFWDLRAGPLTYRDSKYPTVKALETIVGIVLGTW